MRPQFEVGGELGDRGRLADARRADERNDPRPAFGLQLDATGSRQIRLDNLLQTLADIYLIV